MRSLIALMLTVRLLVDRQCTGSSHSRRHDFLELLSLHRHRRTIRRLQTVRCLTLLLVHDMARALASLFAPLYFRYRPGRGPLWCAVIPRDQKCRAARRRRDLLSACDAIVLTIVEEESSQAFCSPTHTLCECIRIKLFLRSSFKASSN
jgi:hypothetical protein